MKSVINHATSPYPQRGEPDGRLIALAKLAPALEHLAKDVAVLMNDHHLESAEIALEGGTNGTITLKRSQKSGLSVTLHGSLAAHDQPLSGTPYYAHYNGEYFWRPTPESDDFVRDGDQVRAGQLVGWAMGESKDMSFGLRADQDGMIHLVAPHASKVKEGETLLYLIKGRQ